MSDRLITAKAMVEFSGKSWAYEFFRLLRCPMKQMVLVIAILGCSPLWAGSAAWYKWHSQENQFDICSQTSPGDGWVAVKGPFEDANCKKLGIPH